MCAGPACLPQRPRVPARWLRQAAPGRKPGGTGHSPWGRPEVNAQNTMTRLSSESLVFAGLFSSFLLFSSLRKMKCTASVTRARCPERAHI